MAGPHMMDEKERKAKVSSLLHATEASIKKADFEDALSKIREIYVLDGRNPYAHAFEERIVAIRKKRDEKAAETKAAEAKAAALKPAEANAAPAKAPAGSAAAKAPQHAAPVPPSEPTAPKGPVLVSITPKPAAEHTLSANQPVAGVPLPQPKQTIEMHPPQLDPIEELQKSFELERVKWREEKAFIIGHESLKTKERLLSAYKAFVMLMDVSLPKEQLDTLLLSLRGILDVSEQEHSEIIRSVQVNAYADALTSAWHKGSVTAAEIADLQGLRGMYGISDAEHLQQLRQVKRKLGLPDLPDLRLAVGGAD